MFLPHVVFSTHCNHTCNPTSTGTPAHAACRGHWLPVWQSLMYSHAAEINTVHPALFPRACSALGLSDISLHVSLSHLKLPGSLFFFASPPFFARTLTIEVPQGSVWGLFLSLSTFLSLGNLYANNSQIYISSFNHFSELQLQISNVLLDVSTWMCSGHIRLNMARAKPSIPKLSCPEHSHVHTCPHTCTHMHTQR